MSCQEFERDSAERVDEHAAIDYRELEILEPVIRLLVARGTRSV